MTPFLAAPAHFPFAPEAAVFIWLVGAGLTVPALIVAWVASRKYAARPVFALKAFRAAAILAILDVAALVTVSISLVYNRAAWKEVQTHRVDYGFWMFQFAATSVLWGLLLLIRKKLITSAARSGS